MMRTRFPDPHEQRKVEQLLSILAKKKPVSTKPPAAPLSR